MSAATLPVRIRPATLNDVSFIHAIYRESVLHGTASWELVPPDLAEMQRRMKALLAQKYPYFVASLYFGCDENRSFPHGFSREASSGFPAEHSIDEQIDERVVGYAYASSYRTRPGYRFTVENSIYVNPAYQRRGIARQLMVTLIDACTERGYRQMMAVIGDSQNRASIALHQSLGFEHVGIFRNIGYKFGRWLDGVYMQRALGEGATTPPQEYE